MSDQYNQDNLNQDFQNSSLGGNQSQQQQQQSQQQGYYDPNQAQAFVPSGGYQQFQAYQPQQQYGAYTPGQGGYQPNYNNKGGYQQYNNRGGYQQYNNRGGYQQYGGYQQNQQYGGYQQQQQQQQYGGYQAYNPQASQPPQQPTGMSLADFEKQKSAQQSSLNKPVKKTLKLAPSSGIKLANSSKKEDASATPPAASKESSPAPSVDEKKKTEIEVKETKKDADASKAEAPSTAAVEKPVEKPNKESTPTPKETTPAPAKSKQSTPVPAKAPTSVTADTVAKEQEDEVDEEVVKDMFGGKDHVSIIFMGHVDAGKSTMGGNILYLTGSVDKRTVEKYEREAKDAGRQGWYLSWVMDTNKEERNDGKTIEVGKAYFETDKRRYTILDAPGHKMYVSEMIGGASQADVGILVISARKGEYETGFEKGGQTREHALLAKTQGVNKIVVVVNKMDDPTVNWSQERYNECTTKLGVFLKGIGYNKEDIINMPVSGYTGAGLKDRVSAKDCPWYTGPSLLEFLDNMSTVNRKINGPFMLPISGKMKDMGTVVEGKIESGHIRKGGSLLMMPNKTPIEVITIYNETEQECDTAFSGEQVRLKIKGVEEEDLQPGYVLTSPKNPVKTVTKFEAQIAIVELKSILSNGFSCVMHLHTAIEEVTFVELKHKLEKGTNRKSKKPPAFAKKGMKIIAVLECNEPVCAETYNDYPQLGRFTLRDQGTTIAIGKITKLLK
ncbi:Sup35 translation factor eRF3 [Candida orthopsilosis Co 90-125]|uniref:Eukaryotic peptide chain release factor GTP-binding subunit n=1 Tax=Candida orthopsilosis (strain 90-125) TaxID=1136231 RepID=H8X351_CANO9|nr:Sup35 translation factor eRF3 [Candida orthopsilosis Co 90-125]CCG25911.1 Sup35 translation factor eRF3 [Candida orthopsilosis Co 90-125]